MSLRRSCLQSSNYAAGRRLLMDFGSSLWPDSLGWLVDRYSERGVDFFDEIWAWEAADTNHSEYWSQVPADLQHRLHVSGSTQSQGSLQAVTLLCCAPHRCSCLSGCSSTTFRWEAMSTRSITRCSG